ncbi:long-chain-fatty-acid--CoA ligase [Paracraurococcus ruber]|uniref:Dicarboxylate--CoA ligase PimA n=1 Tax=Paracraurococcus ruber TaxID=77675 RepID=A0ABS1CVV1_9PROT|nr:long-chain fatty acid--CoA ligase [Paracraurococcus ruber]MBK1658650.1 dicarboxylate--CoA ligase PimA [Paracraurococcus ruber]TDG29612.1 long-chain fatty acid--CoA ligase [Paracraurococcus ruber]
MDTLTPETAPPSLPAYPAGIAWAMPLPPMTLVEIFDGAAARFADRPCLDFLGRRWTYRAVAADVARVAAGFRRLGAGPGTRIGLCLPNGPHYVIAFFAALRCGATVVNFNPLYVPAELAAQARDSGTEIMVAPDLVPILGRVLGLLEDGGPVRQVVACPFAATLPPLKSVLFRLLKRKALAPIPAGQPRVLRWDLLLDSPPMDLPAPRPEDLAVLQYTGGTTGTPKAAMLTHANLAANWRQVASWSPQLRPGEERMLAVLPFFHVFALSSVLGAAIHMGAEIVMLPRFEPATLIAALRRTRPTVFHGVPTLFKAVIDHGATQADLASVKICISGGAPLPLEIKRAFEEKSGCRVVEGYGLTEASPVCFCNPAEGLQKDGSIGLPVPGVRAEIRALDDPGRALPPGERGELCIAGPNVMAGYWNRPAETAAVIGPDGFLRTGDVGIMDQDGFVTLVDRIKDLILCSGYNVYPRVIEEALYTHPAVVAATVVGQPDAYRGESPAAFVQLQPGSTLTVDGLRAHLKARISAIEMPKLIEIRATLPRTAVGKLSKKELREELLQRGKGA